MQELEQKIRERAYHLWQADGGQGGNFDAYWLEAQREILASSLPEVAPSVKKPGHKAKPVTVGKTKKQSSLKPRQSG